MFPKVRPMHNVAGRFAALIALFVLAVPAVRAATVPDGGLLVTQVNSEQWEITLVGGSASREFSGSVTSSTPFYSSSGAGLESSDVVTQTSTATLNMTLDVAAGRVDTARFSVSVDASLCLRGSGTPTIATARPALPQGAFGLHGGQALVL